MSMRDAMKAGTQAPQTGVACVLRAGSAYNEMVWGAHRGFLYCVASRVLGRSAIARLREERAARHATPDEAAHGSRRQG
ncbi:hypothetical protein HRbin27_00084 [bacterium HR27]|nr:hypothetical protein HRbin27_00084 [bacterium HR27]